VSGQLQAPTALPPGKSPRYTFYRRMGGPQSRSGRYGEVYIFYPTGTRTRQAHSQSEGQYIKFQKYVEPKVFTAVTMGTMFVWDVTPCSVVAVHRTFGGTCSLQLRCRRVSNQKEGSSTARYSETSTRFCRTIRHTIPDDNILQN
jgi:hypothetical protein